MTKRHTLAHVTHEAVEQLGGIGAVLEGLITSPTYKEHVKRSILIGPMASHMAVDPQHRLGEEGKVLYSSIDGVDEGGFGGKFRPIEWAFNVKIVYGTRRFVAQGGHRDGEAEVLLIDVFQINHDRLNVFKLRLWETFGIDSSKYEKSWDFEEYVRLAEPAYYALRALLHEEDLPCVLFSHEFMGMPAVMQAILDGEREFRTVFHAHECATARRIVEDHPGHDTMFYNVMRLARARHMHVEDVFGGLQEFFRHALVSRTHLCDGILAVGDCTRDELKFLNEKFDQKTVDLVFNGIPAKKVDLKAKLASRKMLLDYSTSILGHTPDVLLTHVTRPVISKGLWRDLTVCHHLDEMLGKQGKNGVLYILTSAGGTRRPQDVLAMERNYNWPRSHRPGYPDLVGPEEQLWRDIDAFNFGHRHMQVVLVNQFGWTRSRIGARLPEKMDFADLRRATDVEFGMATYEPFGISPLEPLGCGGICVISAVCGCRAFVDSATGGKGTPNVITADFTKLDHNRSIDDLKAMGQDERDHIEQIVSAEVATEIMRRLPWTDAQRAKLLESGQALVAKMGWDQVVAESLVPVLDRITADAESSGATSGVRRRG